LCSRVSGLASSDFQLAGQDMGRAALYNPGTQRAGDDMPTCLSDLPGMGD